MKLKVYSFKYRVINFLHRKKILERFNFTVKKGNSSIFNKVPILNGMGKNHLVNKEEWMNNVLNRLLKRDSDEVFVDVGVNIGQTLIKVKEITPEIEFIGFEPNPFCYYYVDHLIELNKINNVEVVCCGISNVTSQIELLLDNKSKIDPSASILRDFRTGKFKKIMVTVFNPNELEVLRNRKIGYIKIDVEGAELEVLKGFEKIIKNSKPAVLCEILPVATRDDILRLSRLEQINSFLKEINYSIFRIDMQSGDLLWLDEIDVTNQYDLCNYVFLPKNGPNL